jgi:isopentenyldiphosphate isomerase
MQVVNTMGLRCRLTVLALLAIAYVLTSQFFAFDITKDSNKYKSSMEMIAYSLDGRVYSNESSISIQYAHRHNISHRGVWVFVMNSNHSSILFAKRSVDSVTCPDTWSANGEHSHKNESYDTTAIRCLFEELGVSSPHVISLQLLSKKVEQYFINYDDIHYDNQFTMVYLAIIDETKMQLDLKENSIVEWISLPTIRNWLYSCPLQKCIACKVKSIRLREENSAVNKYFQNFAELQMRYLSALL